MTTTTADAGTDAAGAPIDEERRSAWERLPAELQRALLEAIPGEHLRVPLRGYLSARERTLRNERMHRQHACNRAAGLSSGDSVRVLMARHHLKRRRVEEILASPYDP